MHWTNNIVNMLLSGNTNFSGTPVLPEHHDFAEIEAMPSPRILAFHTHFKFLPKQVKENKAKVVYIERNPKDVLTSWCLMMKDLTMDIYRGNFSGFFRFFLQNDCEYEKLNCFITFPVIVHV